MSHLTCAAHKRRVLVLQNSVIHKTSGKVADKCNSKEFLIKRSRFAAEDIRRWIDTYRAQDLLKDIFGKGDGGNGKNVG